MIILHVGENASARVRGVIANAKGAVFHRDPELPLEKCVELIGNWLAEQKKKQLATSEPAVIVMDPAEAEDESQLAALMSLRRMSRWVGVDIHLVGNTKAKPAADKVVRNQAELNTIQKIDSQVGGNADPINDPPMEPFRRVKTEVPTWREMMAVSGYPEQRAKEPSVPKTDALPGCATPRRPANIAMRPGSQDGSRRAGRQSRQRRPSGAS